MTQNRASLDNLLGLFLSLRTLNLGNASRRFLAQETTSPVTTDLLEAVVVVVLDSLDELAQVGLVVRLDLGEGDTRTCLPAN